MIAHNAAHLALRSRAASLTICTTGSAALAATATGFTRSVGSFLTDGFALGMEVISSGFSTPANNGVGVVTAATATAMTVSMFVLTIVNGAQSVARPATVVEAEAAGRTIAARLPSMRGYENMPLAPVPGIPYVIEEYSPSNSTLLTCPAQNGFVEETGDYFLTWYGVTALGNIPGIGSTALRTSVDALKALFAPGTFLAAGTDKVRVRENPAPQTGQIVPLAGWAALQLKVPWWALTLNTVAA